MSPWGQSSVSCVSFSTLGRPSPHTTAGQSHSACLWRLSPVDLERHQGSNWNSSWMPSQADWVKLIIFSCHNESISSAQQLSISTVATHLIQLNFTQALFIADNLDVAAVSFKQMNLTFSWNLLCCPCCGHCWLTDCKEQIKSAAEGIWPLRELFTIFKA